MNAGPVGILLAAGRGTRFGINKLLYPLADGMPMAVACARRLRGVLPRVIAVVEDLEQEIAALLRAEGLRVVANPRAREGMGTSIARGVAASAAAPAWVIALADMPNVPQATIHALVERLEQGADLVAPVYYGKRGHPVGFSRRHAAALLQLRADEGGRGILAANSGSLELIRVQDPGVILDVDRPIPGRVV
jgi:molybdenum cofactor cytidylyltransferase